MSSGPPGQRKQSLHWGSCRGSGSSWWHPASPPQWWKWYSLGRSGQARAGTPYMWEREGRGRKRNRERVKVVTLLPLTGNLTPKRPPAERHLSISPPLLLSPLLFSTCKELGVWGGVGKGHDCGETGWRLKWWMLALQLLRRRTSV